MVAEKLILMVEIKIKPEFRDEIVAALHENLPLTRAEAGVETFYQLARHDDANALIMFEVFESEATHHFHMEQDYTKKVMKALDGKLLGPPVVARLVEY